MNWTLVTAVGASLLLAACKRPSDACRGRTQRLRNQIAAIDWSVVGLYDLVPYLEIPIGDGNQVGDEEGSDWHSPIVIDGSRVKSHGETHADDASLNEWLLGSAGIFHPKPWPLYLLPTKNTRVALVRRVAGILAPLGEVRVGVRPARLVPPWRPRKDRQRFYDGKTRSVTADKHNEWSEELVMSVLVPAEGCPEAIAVAKHPWMSPADRLARLPDAFETCACEGDMDTMAALYWFQALNGYAAIRWHAWDDAVAEQVGDDATYADLARVLTERYRARQGQEKDGHSGDSAGP